MPIEPIEETKSKGIKEVCLGVALILVGVLGLFFGKNAKTRILRISILVLSVCSIGGGLYFLVSGLDDLALGVAGQYKLGGPPIQSFSFANPEEMIKGLSESLKFNKSLRRLHFKCADGSKSFTIYMAKFGFFGVPKHDIVCADGKKFFSFGDTGKK